MKPEVQLTNFNAEQLPVNNRPNIEYTQKLDQEPLIKNGTEHYEQKSESGAVISDVGITTSLPAPVKDDNKVVDNTTITTQVNLPVIANDDDLIEKEWVDRAKKIVSETRNDPRKQEEEVSKLQIDYLKKRYGREIGAAK